ncbi:MAG: hypothetical protein R3F37_01855 [Candidatus Competibacteraceae bacterium]
MPIDRLGISFSAKPNVTIDGQRYDVSKQDQLQEFTIGNKSYKGIQIDDNTFLAVTKKRGLGGSKYQLDLMSTADAPDALEKWKVKVGGGKINQLGYMGDTFTAKNAQSVSGTLTLNDQFANQFRQQAQSQAAQELRKAGLKIEDEELHQLRMQGVYTRDLHAQLTDKHVSKQDRQDFLNGLLGKPGDNELTLTSNANPLNQPQSVSLNQSFSTDGMDIEEDDDDDEVNVPDDANINEIDDDDDDDDKDQQLLLNILQMRSSIAKQVRELSNPQLQQQFEQLQNDYMDKNPPERSLEQWAQKFMDFEDKLNGPDQQNASPEPKALTHAQHSAKNYVNFKFNDKEFMAKVEDKVDQEFSTLEIRMLKRRINERIAASSDLENKPVKDIQKAAGKIMMQEIGKYARANQETMRQLESLPEPTNPIKSGDGFDDQPSNRIKSGDSFEDDHNEVIGSANNNSSSDPVGKKRQIRNYNRNQAQRYLEKDGVMGHLIRDAKQKTDGGKDTRLDGRNSLNSREQKDLKAAITKAFVECSKPLTSVRQHQVALEATLKYIEMPPDLDD